MNPPRIKQHQQNSSVRSLRLLGLLSLCVILPLMLKAAPPSWWTPNVIDANKQANDYAGVNQGQLKNIAEKALAEMDAHLPVDTSDALHLLVTSWYLPTASTNDYAAVNLGQVKNVAKMFYDRFKAQQYTDRYPWGATSTPANDYLAVNIGQVKNLFSFDFTKAGAGLDLDHNGLLDQWEMTYFGHTGLDPNASVVSGSGFTILQMYQQAPTSGGIVVGPFLSVAVVGGNNQAGKPSTTLPLPLTIKVTATPAFQNPVPYAASGALVWFSTDEGSLNGQGARIFLETNQVGEAQVALTLPASAPTICHISVQTVLGGCIPMLGLPVPIITAASVDVNNGGTNGDTTDLDGNGLPDWWEVKYFGANGQTASADPTYSGITNLQKYQMGLDPTVFSTADDGITDGWKLLHGFDAHLVLSTVRDGIPDSWKTQYGLDINDTDLANEDLDGDGLTNADEYAAGTDPMKWDTDGDYLGDGQDIAPLVKNPAKVEAELVVPSGEIESRKIHPNYALIDYTKIALRWTPASNGGTATGYRIEKRIDSNPWVELATVGSNVTNTGDQGLVANRQYQYRIIALKDAGTTHIEAESTIIKYQVPLGLRFVAKTSAFTGAKSDWSWKGDTIPANQSNLPPIYYLVRSTKSSIDYDPKTEYSNSLVGEYNLKDFYIPDQHLNIKAGDWYYNVDEADGSYDYGLSKYDWFDQKRSPHHPVADTHGSGSYNIDRSFHGGLFNYNWIGDYSLTGAYKAASGKPVWKETDFDTSKGTLIWSGSSSYALHDWSPPDVSSTSTVDKNTGLWTRTPLDPQDGSKPSWDGIWELLQKSSTYEYWSYFATGIQYAPYITTTTKLSSVYETAAFVNNTISDLPDYPDDWDKDYYGWAKEDWDKLGSYTDETLGSFQQYYCGLGGLKVAKRKLSDTEDSFEISKIKYKFTANPSATTILKWAEVFVPDDNPANIQIIAERAWSLGAGDCPEYEIDPTSRTANGYYTIMIAPAHISTPDIGGAGKDVTGLDTDPGKVVLINDGDADADGIPDYAEGYGLLPNLGDGYEDQTGNFTPLYISWAQMDVIKGKIKITYDASDPLAVNQTGSNEYKLPQNGKLRLWTKGQLDHRNGADLKHGGDYIKPGVEYSWSDLGDGAGYGGMVVYAEAVKTSANVADLPIKAEIDATGSLGYIWNDQLRFTTTKIELVGKQYGEQGFSTVNRLINSNLDQFDPIVHAYETTPASYEVNRVRIYDPRATAIKRVKVGPSYLPVVKNGIFFETGDFLCIRPGTTPVNWTGTAGLVYLAAGTCNIEYNPFNVIDWLCGFRRSSNQKKYVQDVVDRIAKELHDDQSWINNYKLGDDGKFGKEMDKRLAAHFTAKSGWYTNVWVKKSTGQILSTGIPLKKSQLPADLSDVMEIDILYTKGGYKITTVPNAYALGKPLEKLDKAGLIFASEVKTLARLNPASEAIEIQLANYKLVTGLKDVYLADTAFMYKGGTVVPNVIRGRVGRLMSLAGGAFIISSSLINTAEGMNEANAKLDETIKTVVNDRAIFLDSDTKGPEAAAAKYDAATAISQWMHLVIPDDISYGLASLPLYKWVFEDTPANAIWNHDPLVDDSYDDAITDYIDDD